MSTGIGVQSPDRGLDINELNITLDQIETFESSLVWKEFLKTINERKELIEDVLDTSSDINEILRNQGQMLSMKFIMTLPDLLKVDVERQNERKNEEDEEAKDA